VQRRSARVVEPCVVSGCSGQICAGEPLFSTCEWRPGYACFANATCAPQRGGVCGWTMTDELRACLAEAAQEPR
jgi:eight-cysteine-cluster-containing protein